MYAENGKENEVYFSSPGGEIRTYLLHSPNDTEQPYVNEPSAPATPLISQQDEFRLPATQEYNTMYFCCNFYFYL